MVKINLVKLLCKHAALIFAFFNYCAHSNDLCIFVFSCCRYIGGEYVNRLRKRYKRYIEESIILQEASRKPQAYAIFESLQSIIVGKDYVSEDPSSLEDINIREFGNLIRVNDEMAKYFYELHAYVKPYFTKRVTRNTPSIAKRTLASNPELMALITHLFSSESDELQQGNTTFTLSW